MIKNQFPYFSPKTYVVGTQKNCLNEMVLLSYQNLSSNCWVRKYSQFYAQNELSLAMITCLSGVKHGVFFISKGSFNSLVYHGVKHCVFFISKGSFNSHVYGEVKHGVFFISKEASTYLFIM